MGLQFVFIWVSVGEAYHETLFLSYCDGYSSSYPKENFQRNESRTKRSVFTEKWKSQDLRCKWVILNLWSSTTKNVRPDLQVVWTWLHVVVDQIALTEDWAGKKRNYFLECIIKRYVTRLKSESTYMHVQFVHVLKM